MPRSSPQTDSSPFEWIDTVSKLMVKIGCLVVVSSSFKATDLEGLGQLPPQWSRGRRTLERDGFSTIRPCWVIHGVPHS